MKFDVASAVLFALALIPNGVINVAYVTILWVLPISILMVVRGTAVKNRCGINLKAVTCPNCQCTIPKLPSPESVREALWGGPCTNCGCELDKWGRPTTTRQ
jgi:hypothetical protein